MESRLADCSRTLRPGERIDVVAYGCTSASMVIGPAGVAARVHEGRPDVPVTNPVSAAVAGLGAMGAKRIALLTPYIDEVNQGMRNFFVGQGLEVPVMGSFNHPDDNEVARISERVDLGRAGRAGVERRRRRRVHLVHQPRVSAASSSRRAATRQADHVVEPRACMARAAAGRRRRAAGRSRPSVPHAAAVSGRRRRDRAQVPAAGAAAGQGARVGDRVRDRADVPDGRHRQPAGCAAASGRTASGSG